MSAISRYEVRLKCIELAISLSSEQDPLDQIIDQAERVYTWVNKVEKSGNRSRSRNNKGHHQRNNDNRYTRKRDYYNDEDEQQHIEHGNRQSPDLFD